MNQDIKYLHHIQLGHESGLKFFMSKYGRSLRFFAYSIIHNKEAAEEIVSDSFCKIWHGRDRIKSIEGIKSFLFTCTRNACYDYLRAPKNNINKEIDSFLNLIEPSADTLSKMIYVELIEQVMEEVSKLPQLQASVFRMSYLEGLSTEEICQNLETTSSTIYFARSKALSTIRKVFGGKNQKLYLALLQGLGYFFLHTI